MKYLSFILAICVLFLSTMPASLDDKCMSKHQVEQKDICNQECNNEDQSCSDCCSPFLQCNTCSGFPQLKDEPFSCKPPTNIFIKNIFYVADNNNCDFISSIWQPPRV